MMILAERLVKFVISHWLVSIHLLLVKLSWSVEKSVFLVSFLSRIMTSFKRHLTFVLC